MREGKLRIPPTDMGSHLMNTQCGFSFFLYRLKNSVSDSEEVIIKLRI